MSATIHLAVVHTMLPMWHTHTTVRTTFLSSIWFRLYFFLFSIKKKLFFLKFKFEEYFDIFVCFKIVSFHKHKNAFLWTLFIVDFSLKKNFSQKKTVFSSNYLKRQIQKKCSFPNTKMNICFEHSLGNWYWFNFLGS